LDLMISSSLDKMASTTKFVPFTEESFAKIVKRITDEKQQVDAVITNDIVNPAATSAGQKASNTFQSMLADQRQKQVKRRPNPALIAGKRFPEMLGTFPAELYGKPIEDIDEYYGNKFVSIPISMCCDCFVFFRLCLILN